MSDTGEDASGYSPLLAQMLKVDPNKLGDVSLSALGRQAMGSETEAYKAAVAEVTAAREAMKAALENRKGRIDPTMLALAQGFLAPTKTGSFGESLGTAIGSYQLAQAKEESRAAELAKMRLDLANSAIREEKEAATLGLNVASKLTPKFTALQQQVQSEGIDPRSPKGIQRILELQAIDKATPEMREFAASQGILLTDPTFASRFRVAQANKPLTDVGARLGVDLATPEGRQSAQAELQREAFRRENPEVAKALASFGGDPLKISDRQRAEEIVTREAFRRENPEVAKALASFGGDPLKIADRLRAQEIVTRARNLEESSKSQSIATSRLQADRLRQEIEENRRTGNPTAVAETARAAGVPLDTRDRYAGLTPKEKAEKQTRDREAADKYVSEKINPFLAGLDDDVNNLRRALELNKQINTGIVKGMGYGVGEAAKYLSGDRAKFNEFDSLAALSAKQNRIPGDSNVSNIDVQMMRLGTFSSDKERSSNDTIIQYQLAQRLRDRDYQNYMSNYAAVNGAITPHATAEWRRYLDANPIIARDKNGKLIMNPNWVSHTTYFAAPRVKVDATGKEKR